MSWGALGWAAKQKPGKIADKLVLIALADRHNEEQDMAWPSVAWLCEFTGADRKTVIASLARLEALALIADSGERFGQTKQIKGYRLSLNSPEKGIPKTGQLKSPVFPVKSPVFPIKESQKRDTEPSIEPSKNQEVVDESVDAPLSATEVVEAWNEMATRHGLPAVKRLTPERRRKLAIRLRENTLDEWRAAIGAIDRSKFLRGENQRGWRASFDFLLQPSSFTKLTEGTYDHV